jgi:hypothetical protein
VAERACAHMAQRPSSNGYREGHAGGGDFVCSPASGSELDREGAGHASASCLPAPRQLGDGLNDARTRCQQGRRKQRRCVRPCHRVHGTNIMAA